MPPLSTVYSGRTFPRNGGWNNSRLFTSFKNAYPSCCYLPRFCKPFKVYTDTSDYRLGAVLAQNPDGTDRLICCASWLLNCAKQNYTTTKTECLATVSGLRTFRHFLMEELLEVLIDYPSLCWLHIMKGGRTLLHQWQAKL